MANDAAKIKYGLEIRRAPNNAQQLKEETKLQFKRCTLDLEGSVGRLEIRSDPAKLATDREAAEAILAERARHIQVALIARVAAIGRLRGLQDFQVAIGQGRVADAAFLGRDALEEPTKIRRITCRRCRKRSRSA